MGHHYARDITTQGTPPHRGHFTGAHHPGSGISTRLKVREERLMSTFPVLRAINAEKYHLNSPITTKASQITCFFVVAETGMSETLLGPGQTL